jgi:dienelactone hydrolase
MKKKVLIFTGLILFAISSSLSARAIIKPKTPVVLKPSVVRSKTINRVVTRDIKFDLDELNISGTLTLPDGDGYYPLVIIDTSTDKENIDFNKAVASFVSDLTEEGIASFTFDYEDIGKVDYSTIIDLTDYLGGLDEINQSRIGLLGWDEGANNVLLAAINNSSQNYESIATWSPFLADEDKPSTKVVVSYRSAFAVNHGFGWRGPKPVSKKVVYTDNLNDTLEYIKDLKIPVASFYGTDDDKSTISVSEKIYEFSSNRSSKLIAIEDANHTFDYFTKDLSKFDELKENTLNWFIDTLK